VTDCDGNRDLITDGYNGFVIKNNSIADFTEKVLELWNNSDLLENLSKNAYKTFSKRYNIDNNISKLESIYTECSKK
jgi:glycosyltransferase involved in cell wall biosynthesis